MSNKPVQLERIGLNINTVGYDFKRPLSPVPRHPGIVLHHMGTGSFTGDTQRHPGRVVHDMHLRNGWAGIGYHGIATQQGKYFTGRTYRTSGSHCPGQNHCFGLLWFGGLGDQPSQAALETLARAVAWVAIDNDFIPSAQTVTGHGDHLATACPGNLYRHLPDIIRRATAIVEQTKSPAQAIPPATPQGTLPAPIQIASAKGLANGAEVDVLIVNGKSWFFGDHLGAQWDPDRKLAYITSDSLPRPK